MSYHPDKTGRGDQDSVFLAIQEAHDNLVNPEKRRAYDSQNEFDDKIPTGNEKPARFYKLYGDCFVLNGRFAVKTPVPELGDDDTPIEEVHEVLLCVVWVPCGCSCRLRALQQREHALANTAHLVKHVFFVSNRGGTKVYAFYDYWEKFESWRNFEFSEEREHNPDQANSREEKRWMIKENMKGVKNLKKKDNARIISLVERARQRDPRLARAAAEEKDAKAAKKQAKNTEKYAAENKAKADKEAAEQAAKDAIEAEKEAKKVSQEHHKHLYSLSF
jgi:DnaJ family protein C protein 2